MIVFISPVKAALGKMTGTDSVSYLSGRKLCLLLGLWWCYPLVFMDISSLASTLFCLCMWQPTGIMAIQSVNSLLASYQVCRLLFIQLSIVNSLLSTYSISTHCYPSISLLSCRLDKASIHTKTKILRAIHSWAISIYWDSHHIHIDII